MNKNKFLSTQLRRRICDLALEYTNKAIAEFNYPCFQKETEFF